MKTLICLTGFMLVLVKSTFTQTKASATIGVTIVSPVGTTKTSDIQFDLNPVQNETIIIKTQQPATEGANVNTAVATRQIASFNVIAANAVYAVTLPINTVIAQRKNGNETLTVGLFDTRKELSNTSSPDKVNIGAVVQVKGTDKFGFYSNNTPFAITINYN